MSKRFKGKSCVYCRIVKSTTGDHIFARNLFLERRRANLPKVPACEACNRKKSELEHYVATVFPFGGRHSDSLQNLKAMASRRLKKNRRLHAHIRKGATRIWVHERGLMRPTMSIPLDWGKVEEWIVYIVKGLSWHHWSTLVDSESVVTVLALGENNQQSKMFYNLFARMPAKARISHNVGSGTIEYEAVQYARNPEISLWLLSIYGGISFAEGSATASKIGVFVEPKQVFDRIRARAMWLRGQPPGN